MKQMETKAQKTKYFDYAATTPCQQEVVDAMLPYLNEVFGNPHSRSHQYGWDAEQAVENARAQIAQLINANPDEIVFTSGATESNNLAIKGFALGPSMDPSRKKKIVSITSEHKCVIESLRALKQQGFNIVMLPVQESGLVDLESLRKELDDAALVSISYINNETGVIQNIPEISKMCREHKVFLHVDAAQAFGKIPINAREVDMLSISGHKIYGPKGIGALFVSKNPRVRLTSLISGGGQERGIRSGTLPTMLCVGLGKAAEIAGKRMQQDYAQAKVFHDMVYNEVVSKIPEVYINGVLEHKVPYIINISVPYVEGESLMMRMSDFALASGSACTSKSLEPSHVIRAMHPDDQDLAHSSLRVCFGRGTTEDEVLSLISALKKNITELRDLSPLWSMFKKGVDLKKINWQAH